MANRKGNQQPTAAVVHSAGTGAAPPHLVHRTQPRVSMEPAFSLYAARPLSNDLISAAVPKPNTHLKYGCTSTFPPIKTITHSTYKVH